MRGQNVVCINPGALGHSTQACTSLPHRQKLCQMSCAGVHWLGLHPKFLQSNWGHFPLLEVSSRKGNTCPPSLSRYNRSTWTWTRHCGASWPREGIEIWALWTHPALYAPALPYPILPCSTCPVLAPALGSLPPAGLCYPTGFDRPASPLAPWPITRCFTTLLHQLLPMYYFLELKWATQNHYSFRAKYVRI